MLSHYQLYIEVFEKNKIKFQACRNNCGNNITTLLLLNSYYNHNKSITNIYCDLDHNENYRPISYTNLTGTERA